MNLDLVADSFYRELGSPSDFSVPSTSFWIKEHIGDLNNLLGTEFYIASDTNSVVPEIGDAEKSVLRCLFKLYFYERRIQQFLGAASVDVFLDVSSDGATVRSVNKNEISKSYIQMKKEESSLLDNLVKSYIINSVNPQQVAGEDGSTTLYCYTPYPRRNG